MRNSIFKKAYKFFQENRVIFDFENDTSIFFKIVPSRFKPNEKLLEEEYYSVSFFYQDYALKHSCTCKLMTARDPTFMCSHKVACLFWMMKEEENGGIHKNKS